MSLREKISNRESHFNFWLQARGLYAGASGFGFETTAGRDISRQGQNMALTALFYWSLLAFEYWLSSTGFRVLASSPIILCDRHLENLAAGGGGHAPPTVNPEPVTSPHQLWGLGLEAEG